MAQCYIRVKPKRNKQIELLGFKFTEKHPRVQYSRISGNIKKLRSEDSKPEV